MTSVDNTSVNGLQTQSVSPYFSKPLAAAAMATALDKAFITSNDWKRSLAFGGVVGASILASMVVSDIIPYPAILPSNTGYDSPTLTRRIVEIAMGAGGAYALDKAQNNYQTKEGMYRLGFVVLSDIFSEYVSDYLDSRPLAYLS